MTLDDITDPTMRGYTRRLEAIFPHLSIQEIFDALTLKRGHFIDTLNMLSEMNE